MLAGMQDGISAPDATTSPPLCFTKELPIRESQGTFVHSVIQLVVASWHVEVLMVVLIF